MSLVRLDIHNGYSAFMLQSNSGITLVRDAMNLYQTRWTLFSMSRERLIVQEQCADFPNYRLLFKTQQRSDNSPFHMQIQ